MYVQFKIFITHGSKQKTRYHTVGTVANSSRNIVERHTTDILNSISVMVIVRTNFKQYSCTCCVSLGYYIMVVLMKRHNI